MVNCGDCRSFDRRDAQRALTDRYEVRCLRARDFSARYRGHPRRKAQSTSHASPATPTWRLHLRSELRGQLRHADVVALHQEVPNVKARPRNRQHRRDPRASTSRPALVLRSAQHHTRVCHRTPELQRNTVFHLHGDLLTRRAHQNSAAHKAHSVQQHVRVSRDHPLRSFAYT